MKIAVIGGGAAGMMAALSAKESFPSSEVVLIEKNKILGQKVLISGGGRCNVTTGIQHPATVLKNYPRGSKFLYSAMTKFSPLHVYEWFESQGVPLKTEKDLRVFPRSDNGQDVVNAFLRCFQKMQLEVKLNAEVKELRQKDGRFEITVNNSPQLFDRVIIATGGQAYRHTGSTGDGYAFAEALGHTITDLSPSLNSFIVADSWIKKLAGVSHQDVLLKLQGDKKVTYRGPLLFTHQGLSGPAVFAMSALTADKRYNPQNPLSILLDFLPDKTPEDLNSELTQIFHQNHKKLLKNVFGNFLPKSLELALAEQLQLSLEKNCAEIKKKEINKFVAQLKSLTINVIARGAGDEFVTAGGVSLKEVDSKTMESKITPGLFFAGEILDIDGFTGGFNLQASWATGRLAGQSLSA